MLSRSHKRFRSRACATSRTMVYSAIFGVLTITYSQDAITDIDAKDVLLCKDVLFGGLKPKLKHLHPLFPMPPFWDLISTVLRIFGRKTALTFKALRANDP